jgi:hypothetical protein
MTSRTNSALTNRLLVRLATVSGLCLFACLIALTVRALYFRSIANALSHERGRTCCAPGVNINADRETITDVDDHLSSACAVVVSRILRTREHQVTRACLAPPSPALFK